MKGTSQAPHTHPRRDGQQQDDCTLPTLIDCENALDELAICDEDIERHAQDINTVRLPSAIVAAVEEHYDHLLQLYQVSCETLASVGLALIGAAETLPNARKALFELAAEHLGHINVRRLIIERCKFLMVSEDERVLAGQLWRGRRVLLKDTGEVAWVRDVKIEANLDSSLLQISLEISHSLHGDQDAVETDVVPADATICWDTFDTPYAITIVHHDFGTRELNEAYARRLCLQVGLVDSVEILPSSQKVKDACISEVVFDVSKDNSVPARAVAELNGINENGFRLNVRVAAPIIPICVEVATKVAVSSGPSVSCLVCRNVPPTVDDEKLKDQIFATFENAVMDIVDSGVSGDSEERENAAAQAVALPQFKGKLTSPVASGKTVTFQFEQFPPEVFKMTMTMPLVLLKGQFRDNMHATAVALITLIELEETLSRLREQNVGVCSEYSDDQSSAGSSAISFGSSRTQVEPLASKVAIDTLRSLARACKEGKGKLDLRQINDVVRRFWSRPKPRGICRNHIYYELGVNPLPCSNGISCKFGHYLQECNPKKGKCYADKCTRIHSEQLKLLLRLDVGLAELADADRAKGIPLTFEHLTKVLLLEHRKRMSEESDRLISEHQKRIRNCEINLDKEKIVDAHTAAAAERKADIVSVQEGRLRELRRQLDEFQKSKATFLGSHSHSFAASRIFAREVYNRFRTDHEQKCLPIYAERSTILDRLRHDFGVLVLSAETGSGKSTQVVQYLAETIKGKVICSQPRNIAASSLADRVAKEMQTPTPDAEGPNLVVCRGSKCDKSKSRIQFCTDFALLNQLFYQPNLPGVGAVVVDEVHERSVGTDLLVALLRQTLLLRAQDGRYPFRVVLTSATMNEALFAAYFSRSLWDVSSPDDHTWAPVLKVGGRTYPVAIHFDPKGSSPQYQRTAEEKAIELHGELPPSDHKNDEMHDILIFQTAADECERMAKSLEAQLEGVLCVPLHGGLEKDEQRVAINPHDCSQYTRKIVIATNIAEASVTINGIGVVIDPGVSKQARYDPAKDATVLRIGSISQSSARQRAGRAGRTAPGECYRLYSEHEYDQFTQDSPAELLRADATEAMLSVLRQLQKQTEWIDDVRKFPFVEHPGKDRLERALHQLHHMGALESVDSSKLTDEGNEMACMQSGSPRICTILFEARRQKILPFASIAVGMVPTDTPSLFRMGRTDAEKKDASKHRATFAQRFPSLGDIGTGIAIYFDTRKLSFKELKQWCNEHSVKLRALKKCQNQVKSLFFDILKRDSIERAKADAILCQVQENAFEDLDTVFKLQKALMAGFFSSLAFKLPTKKGHEDRPPSYFLPHSGQIACPGKGVAYRDNGFFPDVVAYMEITDTHRVFVSGLFGLKETELKNLLPATYVSTKSFEQLLAEAKQRHIMSTFETIGTSCPLAFHRLLGPQNSFLEALREETRVQAGVDSKETLVIEVDAWNKQLHVACSDEKGREAVASLLQTKLDETATRLQRRRREWAMPGTNVRGVFGNGAQCHEILLRPTQSICVRIEAYDITQRLSEPITTVDGIPGYFLDLLRDDASRTSDVLLKSLDDSLKEVNCSIGTYRVKSQEKQRNITDLHKIPVSSIIAAIEYTAGNICYGVNPFLRKCNEVECRKYEGYIRALVLFYQIRAAHPLNNKGSERVLFRGTQLSEGDIDTKYQPGSLVIWPAFTSTTTSLHVAESFAGGGCPRDGRISVLFEIASSSFCPVHDISQYPGEAEIIFPIFSAFHVVSVKPWKRNNSSLRVLLRYEPDPPETLVVRDVVPLKRSLSDEARQAAGENGPHILESVSKRKGLSAVVDDIGTHLRKFDEDVDVDMNTDPDTERVWGCAWFSSAKRAANAMLFLNGSILGKRELQTRTAPVKTDGLPMRCLVRVTLSAAGFFGIPFCCGPKYAAMIMGQAQKEAYTTKREKKVIPALKLGGHSVNVQGYSLGMDAPPAEGWVLFKRIPQEWTSSRLLQELQKKFCLPLHLRLHPPQFSKKACKSEAKSFEKQGIRGKRARIGFLMGKGGLHGLEFAEEKSVSNGSQCLLWFNTPENAARAAESLDGSVMPGTGLKVYATPECSVEVSFNGDALAVLEGQIDSTIFRINECAETSDAAGTLLLQKRKTGGRGGKCQGKRPKKESLCVIISGSNASEMANAYRELTNLQRGFHINVKAADRPKLFPNRRFKKLLAERINDEMRRLGKQHCCAIRPLFTTSAIRILGTAEAAAAVGRELTDFAKKIPFEDRVRIPRYHQKHMSEFVKTLTDTNVTCEMDKKGHVCVYALKEEAVKKTIEVLKDHLVERGHKSSDTECCVCFEPVERKLVTCGHSPLCSECSSQYIASEVGENKFPISCAACKIPLLSEDVSTLVQDLDGVHSAGIGTFVIQNASKFRYCATPDCTQVLDRSLDSATCAVCMRAQCPRCGEAPHLGETCEANKTRILFEQSHEGKIAHLSRMIRDKFLAPACGGCNAAFLDFSGCFALTCGVCRGGICGFCLAYTGMTDAHGHTADCKWFRQHLGNGPSAHFGHNNKMNLTGVNLFQVCMRMRLPELAAQALGEKVGKDIDLRRAVCKALSSDAMTAEFFDYERFQSLLQ